MSSTHSRTRKRVKLKKARSSRNKSTNALVFKVVEPILQWILIVALVFCEDDGYCQGFFYTQIVYALIGLQVLSAVLNLFLNRNEFELHTKERIIFLAIIVPYMIFYHSRDFADNAAVPFGIGLNPWLFTVLNGGILAMAFWYNIICVREIKSFMKTNDDE